ncbi:CPBP family intramembrane glutamic endopeptidase [Lactobacillus mulieris]|uniref:CPBP family intramembrane metalloprotease n=1 Tax=Lactobacillus mulieris TaxID=2508708 RepID=A0AAW5WX09_9LACO|nr:CPBP family intramembrane glutamic endopeptidase [Lactobacillus mulieris]MCZ3622172.1 CPBP family intramembrane metalloprotease [Lactobacillus mulieris]MCZ3623869.1 CPBP family intramembrane metalloprotease [Lactobacillus mulieris]MCZ3636179.1 CPBP family intramembrane metalloprotease [Lactobacillus mulieris]MCZ3690168.1 CPBP family intramembrane metalloprotease [Lactobacillus mulieris]MCZ3696249.1 CPBP family intramembrane metalloprotease [Lactobacillus mulieris]
MKGNSLKAVLVNWAIVLICFTIISIGLMLLEEFLIEIHYLPVDSWIAILLRYILAVSLLCLFNKQIMQVQFSFEFKLSKLILTSWLIALIYVFYNLTSSNLELKASHQITSFLFCLGPGIFEEIWFRGIIFQNLRKISKTNQLFLPILLSSFLFAVTHLLVPDFLDLSALMRQAIGAFASGILYAVAYLASRNLALPMMMHFSANLLSFFGAGNPFLPAKVNDLLFYQLNDWQYTFVEVATELGLALLILRLYYFEK